MRESKASQAILALGAMLAVLGVAGCGSSSSGAKPEWGDAVVRVGRYTITKPMLEHWTRVEAILTYTYKPIQPVPKGVVPEPPEYTSCIELAAKELPHGTPVNRVALKAQCAKQFKAIQLHILEILITNDWMHEEAIALGVKVSSGEVNEMVSNEFSSARHFKRYLRLTGEQEADYQFIVESELLTIKLQKKAGSKPGLSTEEREDLEGGFGSGVIARWMPRTSCRPGYVIYGCKQFRPRTS